MEEFIMKKTGRNVISSFKTKHDSFVKSVACCLLVLCALVVFAAKAQATTITIDPNNGEYIASGDQNGQTQIDIALELLIPGITGTELYKNDVGTGESGALAGSYSTAFGNTALDPEDATITYGVGGIVGPDAFALVKDGSQTPNWYLFALNDANIASHLALAGVGSSPMDLGWDGMMTLSFVNFWPSQGAISHVTLYGSQTTPPNPPGTVVPEPSTVALLGIGIVSLIGAGVRRRRKQQLNNA
jgi:hypothetical protein